MYPTLATFANCALLPFLLLHAKRERKLENRLLTLPYFQNHTTSNEGESWSRSAFIIIGWYLLERFFQGLWQHSVRMPNTFTEKESPIFGTKISFSGIKRIKYQSTSTYLYLLQLNVVGTIILVCKIKHIHTYFLFMSKIEIVTMNCKIYFLVLSD